MDDMLETRAMVFAECDGDREMRWDVYARGERRRSETRLLYTEDGTSIAFS